MLNNSYYKLKVQNKLNIAYFGGSITAGAGADGYKYSFANLVTNWIKENYPDATIRENNASLGGTGTKFAAYRFIEDLKLRSSADKPDLVFIEYAINDEIDRTSTEDSKLYLETIFRGIYQFVPNADIVILITTDHSEMAKDYLLRQAHKQIADVYNIPTVAIGEKLINDMYKEGEGDIDSVWKKYFSDWVHPSRNGHKNYANTIIEYLKRCFSSKKSELNSVVNSYMPSVAVQQSLQNPHSVTLKEQSAPNGFTINEQGAILSNSGSDKSFTVKFKGTSLRLWYRAEEYAAAIKIEIDGGPSKTIILNRPSNEKMETVATGLSDSEHNVKITLETYNGHEYMEIKRFCITGSDLDSGVQLVY